jgi:hypothetical protein
MPAAVEIRDHELDGSRRTTTRRRWSISRQREIATHLERGPVSSREPAIAHLGGSRASERLMRAVLVVPKDVERELSYHGAERQRHQDFPEALLLHRPHEAFDYGNRAVLADGAEARFDPVRVAPSAILGLKLDAVIADDVSRRAPGTHDGVVEQGANLFGTGFLGEHCGSAHSARVMVEHDDDPPADGPKHEEGKRHHGTQKPAAGTTVRSMCQRWCGCFAVTTRGALGFAVSSVSVLLGFGAVGGSGLGAGAGLLFIRSTVLALRCSPARAKRSAVFLRPQLGAT